MFLKPIFPSFFFDSKNEKLFVEHQFLTLCINDIIMSSSAHGFGCVEFLILDICCCFLRAVEKSKQIFKIRHVDALSM